LRMSLPVAIAFILGFRSSETTKKTLAYLIPILGFASAFILISDEMNYGARFQYAILPIALMSWTPLLTDGRVGLDALSSLYRDHLSVSEKRAYVIALIAMCAGLVFYSWSQNCYLASDQPNCLTPYEKDGRYEMGKLLAEYRDKGYVIAVTEAGLLPYYSGWTAIDTWGLNDPFIAHNGGLTVAYLDKYKPHVIMFHDYYSPLVPPKLTDANLAQPWFSMTIMMKDYAESHDYMLAAIFGDSPYDTHYYYVRSDFEDSKRLIEQISKMTKYYYPTTGKKSINYAEWIIDN